MLLKVFSERSRSLVLYCSVEGSAAGSFNMPRFIEPVHRLDMKSSASFFDWSGIYYALIEWEK
tara:strand:+ start:110 stop:298 length:189 start_codon:yes stop_codon:yes gene_type:complete